MNIKKLSEHWYKNNVNCLTNYLLDNLILGSHTVFISLFHGNSGYCRLALTVPKAVTGFGTNGFLFKDWLFCHNCSPSRTGSIDIWNFREISQ